MRVLGVVIARGGSKGIPNKNIHVLRGKPLIQYTAEAALQSKLANVILTTECSDIQRVGQECGLSVPFTRPTELAQDDTPSLPVIQHAVRFMQEQGESYDAVLTLQPTNPMRLPSDIDGSIDLLENTDADSVISFVDVGEKHPARMKYIEADARVVDPPFGEQFEGQRRQDLKPLYLREGAIYLTRTNVLLEGNSFKGDDCRAWMIPCERACNIDEPFDLVMAEMLMEYADRLQERGPSAN
ncbi:MAG: acylneuraminate cytidylyltransferase family protein [Rubripirellula sp.]